MRPEILIPLFANSTSLPGVGPKLAALIEKVAGPHVVDLILALPHGMIDRSTAYLIEEAPLRSLGTFTVQIGEHRPSRNRRQPYRVRVSDASGEMDLVFFHANADYLQRKMPAGSQRLVSGSVEEFQGSRQMTHPDFIADPDSPEELPLYEPVYPLTAGLSSNVMRKAVANALTRLPDLPEWQDPHWLEAKQWSSFSQSMHSAHHPEYQSALSALTPARQRLAYDELLANQLAICLIRARRVKTEGRTISGDGTLRAKALAALPFSLTDAQQSALDEIFQDMKSPQRMVRLLQGDVGSGKTVVAFLAMLNAVECDQQAAIMAPTEILARQHLETLQPLADEIGITIALITGRDKGQQRAAMLRGLEEGYIDIIIGTHALFQDDIAFKDLGLVIVDEQHRFGVRQRMALAEKGRHPDLLVMTATPIPRTLALTAYGDMDVSAIRSKPPGRKPVATRALPLERLGDVIAAVTRAASKGEQAYWVCPLVEESEVLALTAAQDRFEQLKQHFGERVGLVHGRMSGAEKDAVMTAFHRGDLSVLIATTVIEVGVNAPSATVIVIEHAERFGLAQLHQLRGRVGRGDKDAACILLYKGPLGETAKARLNIMRQSEDGFALAEEDLRLRGAGDLLGAAQSGVPEFQTADLAVHGELLAAARDDAKMIVEQDPTLNGPRGAALRILLYLFKRDDAVRLLQAG